MMPYQGINIRANIRHTVLDIFLIFGPYQLDILKWDLEGGVLHPTLFFVFYFYISNLGRTYKVDSKYG